jgi:hypothetical protein
VGQSQQNQESTVCMALEGTHKEGVICLWEPARKESLELQRSTFTRETRELGMVVHTCNPSTWEANTGES